MVLAGKLNQHIDSVFELANFREALLRVDADDRHGKILLKMERK
jgi:NADPH:quinone reductase-like Zn-dependent oxidoreductase